MLSALLLKSYHDLSKRKARSIFTILTITLGVMGMALFAINPLAERTIDVEIEDQNLYNLRISIPDTRFNRSDLDRLIEVDNVEAVEPALVFEAEMISTSTKDDCWIIGRSDLADGSVDKIILESGSLPLEDQMMTEKWNEKSGAFTGDIGNEIILLDEEKEEIGLSISGVGKSLAYSEGSYDSGGMAVFYCEIETARKISNMTGFNSLSFRLDSTTDEDLERTIGSIWNELNSTKGVQALERTPEIRKNGEWPGGEFLDMFLTVMYILTVLAVVCSVFFIYNTMSTIISEQRKEIATMKAIGASKLQIFGSYMTTSVLLGISGALMGTLIGIPLTYLLLEYFGGLLGFEALFSVHVPTISMSFLAGIVLVIGSSLPAVLKALGVPIREGMEDTGLSNTYGKGVFDKALMRSTWVPRTIQLGLRNSSRRKGRSISTILQIALAVGIFMGLLSFGYSLGEELSSTIDNVDYDMVLTAGSERDHLSNDTKDILNNIENVSYIEPYMETTFNINGLDVHVLGYKPDTRIKLHEKTMIMGTWISESDGYTAVIGEQLSKYSSIHVGDVISVMTPKGPAEVEIVGVDSDFYYMGMVLYIPFKDAMDLTASNGTVSGFFIQTLDGSSGTVDTTTMAIENEFERNGIDVEIAKQYKIKESTIEQNRSIINMMAATSVIIILISMVGLTSNLTMNILERTKEIGVMRCVGAVATKIRTIFTTEVLVLSLLGWFLGIPLGYLVARSISWLIHTMIDWEIKVRFPFSYVIIGLFIVVLGTALIAQLPILRATRIKPGDAIRYQ